MELAFLLGRILFGGYFIWNGVNHFKNLESMTGYAQFKGVPQPKLAVIGGGILLLLGGLGILLWMYVDIALVLLLLFLIPVTFMMHQYWKAPADQKQAERINFEKNMALVGAVLMMFALL